MPFYLRLDFFLKMWTKASHVQNAAVDNRRPES